MLSLLGIDGSGVASNKTQYRSRAELDAAVETSVHTKMISATFGAAMTWFMSMLFGTEERNILMLGLDSAGKTTVLHRLVQGERSNTIPTISLIEADTNPRIGVKRIHSSQSKIGVRQAMTLHSGGSPDADAGRRPPPPSPPKPPPPIPQRMAAVGGAGTLSPPAAGGMATSMSVPIINGRGQIVSRPGSAARAAR